MSALFFPILDDGRRAAPRPLGHDERASFALWFTERVVVDSVASLRAGDAWCDYVLWADATPGAAPLDPDRLREAFGAVLSPDGVLRGAYAGVRLRCPPTRPPVHQLQARVAEFAGERV